jgi:hypothetical protein
MSVIIPSPFKQAANKPVQLQGLSLTFIEQERADFFLKHVEENKDDAYHMRSLEFGFDVGGLTEKALAEGLEFEKVIDKLVQDADYDGLTGNMYGTGISLLGDVWIHKEKIVAWHNGRFKVGLDEQVEKMTALGQVIDPAMINISVGDEQKPANPDGTPPPSDV